MIIPTVGKNQQILLMLSRGKSVNDDTNRINYDLSTEMTEAGSIKNQRLTGEVLFYM